MRSARGDSSASKASLKNIKKYMEKIVMTAAQKRPYEAPRLMVVGTAPILMLAASGDPEVYTTSEKASTDYDPLVKENRHHTLWDDDWSK